jgi:transcription elongation factor Elf1
VKKKKAVKKKRYVLHLTCKNCGHKFKAERFRKYCTYKCQRDINNQLAKTRYAEMREVYLKSKGVIE